MKTKLALVLLAALSLQACAVYVPPMEVDGLVFTHAGDEHHGGQGHHHRGHDSDDDDGDDD
jgi:Spy/CpxP family protein refolding chaperone